MAEESESGGGWAGVVNELIKTFLIIRDVFGYALPGAAFLGIGLFSDKIQASAIASRVGSFPVPVWLGAIILLGVCYLVGLILASAAYLFSDVAKWVIWMLYRAELANEGHNGLHSASRWFRENPTEVSNDLLALRENHPKLLATLDRRETGMLSIGSLCVALLGGFVVFHCPGLDLWTALLIGGILLLIDFITAFSRLRRLRTETLLAGKALKHQAKPSPDLLQH